MGITSFEVGGRKTLVRAVDDSLPNLVIITGANGSGKSSLLTLLRDGGQREPNTTVLHIGPHRPWRKGSLLKASVFSMPFSYNEMLSQSTIPHFSGQAPYSISQFQGTARDPDASDETQALVKVSIAGINEKYRDRLQSIHQERGQIERNDVLDPFKPLRDLIAHLLPHLIFEKIEEENRNDIRILFRSRFSPSGQPFDIDELSSGEKAVITLFLPVLEYQMEKILGIEHAGALRTFLIDEPELHLHPALQADVVAYFRHLTISEKIQFITVTHSPTMIDAAQPDELFYLLPWQSAADGNQFSKLADTPDRLVAIRDLLGSAYAYSRGRPILFMEGEFPQDTSKQTDLGLLELVLPDLRGYVFVPSRGKSQTIEGADRIRRAAIEQEHPVTAFALVDADYDPSDKPWVFPWPVCMVENPLLDSASIAKILLPYGSQGALRGQAAVQQALNNILQARKDDEVRRRLKTLAGVTIIRHDINAVGTSYTVSSDIAAAQAEAAAVATRVEGRKTSVIAEVDEELKSGKALLAFHGKSILKKFHNDHVQIHIPKYVNFVFQLAQEVAQTGFAQSLVQDTIRRINNYFPPGLAEITASETAATLGESIGIDMANLHAWATAREQAFLSGAHAVEVAIDNERDLVRLLNAAHAAGQIKIYNELRPRIIDVLSR